MIRNKGRAYVDSKPPAASYDFEPLNPQGRSDMQTETSSYGKHDKPKMRRSPTNIKTNPKYDNKKPSPNASMGSEGSGASGTAQRSRPRSLVILGTTQTSKRPKGDRSDLSLSSRDLNSPGKDKDTSPILPNPAHEMDPCLILSTPELRKKCAQGLTSPDMTQKRKVTKPKKRSVSLDKLQRQHDCFKHGGQRCCKCTLQLYRTGSMVNVSKQKKNQKNYDSKNIPLPKSHSAGTALFPDKSSKVVPEKNDTKKQPNGTHKPFSTKNPGLEQLDLNLTLPYYMANGLPRSRTAMAPVTISPVKPRHAINYNSNNAVNRDTSSNYDPVHQADAKWAKDETRPKSSTGKADSPLSESQVSSFFKPSPTVWKTPIMKGNKDRFKEDTNLNTETPKNIDGTISRRDNPVAPTDVDSLRLTTPEPSGKRSNDKEEKGTADSSSDKNNEAKTLFIMEPPSQQAKMEQKNNEINLLPLRIVNSKPDSERRSTTADHTPGEMRKDTSPKVDVVSTQKLEDADNNIKYSKSSQDIGSIPEKNTDAQYAVPRTESPVTVAGSAMPVDKYLSLQKELDTPKFVNSEMSINKAPQEEDNSPPFGDTSNSWPRKRPSTPTNKRVAGFQYDSEEDKLIVQSLLARYAAHGSLATSGLSRADMTDYLNTVKQQLGLENELESKQENSNDEPANKSEGSLKDETDNEKPSLVDTFDERESSLPEPERGPKEKSAEKRVIEKEDIDVFSQTTFHVDGEITNSPVVRRRVLVAELGRKKSPGSAPDDDENNNDGNGPVYSNVNDESTTCQGIRSGDIIYTRMIPAYDLWTRTGGFHRDESIPEDLLELGVTEDQYQKVLPLLNECILYKQLESTLSTWLSGCYFAVVFLLLCTLGFAICYLGNMTGIAPGLIFVVAVLLVLIVAGTFQLTKRLTASRFQHSLLAVNRELSPCDILISVNPAGRCGTALAVNFVFFDCLPCQKILLLSIKDKAAENRLLTQISQKHPYLMEVISRDLDGISTKPATVGRKIILSDILVYFAPSFLDSFLYKKASKDGKENYGGGLRGSTLALCEFIRQQGLGEILKGVSEKYSQQTVSQIKQNTRKFTKI